MVMCGFWAAASTNVTKFAKEIIEICNHCTRNPNGEHSEPELKVNFHCRQRIEQEGGTSSKIQTLSTIPSTIVSSQTIASNKIESSDNDHKNSVGVETTDVIEARQKESIEPEKETTTENPTTTNPNLPNRNSDNDSSGHAFTQAIPGNKIESSNNDSKNGIGVETANVIEDRENESIETEIDTTKENPTIMDPNLPIRSSDNGSSGHAFVCLSESYRDTKDIEDETNWDNKSNYSIPSIHSKDLDDDSQKTTHDTKNSKTNPLMTTDFGTNCSEERVVDSVMAWGALVAILGSPAPSSILKNGENKMNKINEIVNLWEDGHARNVSCPDDLGLIGNDLEKSDDNGDIPSNADDFDRNRGKDHSLNLMDMKEHSLQRERESITVS